MSEERLTIAQVLVAVLKHQRLQQVDLARMLEHSTSAAVNKWTAGIRKMKPKTLDKVEVALRLPRGFLTKLWIGVNGLNSALDELSSRDLGQVAWQGKPRSEDLMAAAHHLERLGHAWLNEEKITTGHECLRAAGIVRNACFELIAAGAPKEEVRALAEGILGVRIADPGIEAAAAGSPSEQSAPTRQRRNSEP